MIPRLATAALAAIALGAIAHPSSGQEPSGTPRGTRGAPAREEAFRMLDAYIIGNLQESLGLTDAQFSALVPLVKRLQTDRRAFAQRRQRAVGDLRRLLASGTATEAAVNELLREIKSVESDEPSVLRRDREAVDAALSPLQQAKFRVLEVEVERKIRELMAQVRAQRRGGRGRRPGAQAPPP